MPRELERDHPSERRAAEIERAMDLQLPREPRGVTRQRLARVLGRNPGNRPNVADSALRSEETFVSADAGQDVERRRHARI